MADVKAGQDVAAAFTGDAIEATNSQWQELIKRQGIAPNQAAFELLCRRDILAALAGGDDVAVIAGFFYRDNNANGAFDAGEELSATLLGLPTLDGADAPAIETYAYCFCFGPLKAGETFTLNYDVRGVESFSQELTVQPGLNVLHVPVAPTKPLVYMIPHSHVDPEWRDTLHGYLLREIPQMIDRIALLREQREHVFNFDEELVMRPLVDRYPEFLGELRQRVIDGTIECKGIITAGELLMPLGESMIRQMTDGEQLASKLLGIEVRPSVYWNVDCYGINLQMPQILLKAGRPYFNIGEYVRVWPQIQDDADREVRIAEVPYSNRQAWAEPEFWLEGLDGSKVLVHRSNYGEEPPGTQQAIDKLRSHRSAFSHQGGDFMPPNRKLPAWVLEVNDPVEAAKYDGELTPWDWPKLLSPSGECIHIIATSEQFFRAVEVAGDVPTISTESRLGKWTGCYESRVRGRQLSREVECMLMSTEAISLAAMQAGLPSSLEDLREAWYMMLISHHHDPQLTVMGPELFPEVVERYIESRRSAQRVLDRCTEFLTARVATDQQPGEPIVVFNGLAWDRSSVMTVELPCGSAGDVRVVNSAGAEVASQPITDADGDACVAFAATDVPAAGWQTYYLQDGAAAADDSLIATDDLLENEHIRVEIADGIVQKVIEKSTGQAVFAANDIAAVNELFIWFDDGCVAQIRPVDFMDSAKLLHRSSQADRVTRVVETGPARVAIETSFEMDWGKFVQRVSLSAGAHEVDFETRVDWVPAPEGGRRLRAAFPSTFTGANVWRDVPFAVQPWEQSEVIQPINSWLGLSDEAGTLGAALIHDGPCGQQVRQDVLWQTLLRSTRVAGKLGDKGPDLCGWDEPGDTALEEGLNVFNYRLCVYAGNWKSAAVPRRAMGFTTPMVAASTDRHAGELPGEKSHISVAPADLVQCTWKESDFTDSTIVRIFNPTGDAIDGELMAGFDVASADETNFREEHTGELTIDGGKIALSFSPYEIKTIRLVAK